MSNYGIVQFTAYYYPKGFNLFEDLYGYRHPMDNSSLPLKPKKAKTKKELVEDLEFSDFRYIHFPGGEGLGWHDKLDKAVALNGNTKKAFIIFMITGYAGQSNDVYGW